MGYATPPKIDGSESPTLPGARQWPELTWLADGLRRKRSYGAQSDRGNLFAERVMTVAHTARKQNKNVLSFLIACCRARLDGGRHPSLFVPDVAAA